MKAHEKMPRQKSGIWPGEVRHYAELAVFWRSQYFSVKAFCRTGGTRQRQSIVNLVSLPYRTFKPILKKITTAQRLSPLQQHLRDYASGERLPQFFDFHVSPT
jgi:hypothetical protein